MDIKTFRKEWNADQKRLRGLFSEESNLLAAKELFFKQHQMLHSSVVSGAGTWSYADEIFAGVAEEGFREIPKGEEHSLLWILWHISRIEDVTMHVLVGGRDQEYISGGWADKLASPLHHTGNDAPPEDILALTRTINPQQLLDYRNAVGRNTRALVMALEWDQLNRRVLPERLERLREEEAVLPQSEGLLSYWGKRVIYELLLMPPTRHLMVHLNEARSVKHKLKTR